jgi:ABC-2 type transport system ATP-binding protein
MLILDEPTAGVDIELRRSLWVFLRELNQKGTTIILTTHYLEEAESLCRGIAIINHGKIIERTTVKDILSQLNIETVIFDLKNPLTDTPLIEGCDTELRDPSTLEITFPKTKDLNAIFHSLSNANIHISSMRNKTNRLEELFVRLTQK